MIHHTAFPMIVTDIYFDENNELYAVGKSAEQNWFKLTIQSLLNIKIQ